MRYKRVKKLPYAGNSDRSIVKR
jgi:transposase